MILVENYTESKELWKLEPTVYHRSICPIVACSGNIFLPLLCIPFLLEGYKAFVLS